MSWFFQSETAKEHKRNCDNPDYCDKCVWIDESYNACVDVWEEKQNEKKVEEKEPEMVWDSKIRRYTKGGKLCD